MKKHNMNLNLKNKKGFTLAQVLFYAVVAVMIFTVFFSTIGNSRQLNLDLLDRNDVLYQVNNVENMVKEIKYAYEIDGENLVDYCPENISSAPNDDCKIAIQSTFSMTEEQKRNFTSCQRNVRAYQGTVKDPSSITLSKKDWELTQREDGTFVETEINSQRSYGYFNNAITLTDNERTNAVQYNNIECVAFTKVQNNTLDMEVVKVLIDFKKGKTVYSYETEIAPNAWLSKGE